VKDFEVIASIENHQKSDIFIENIDLKEFLFKEIKDIVNTLIKKKVENFGGDIYLEINIDKDITQIHTDSIRLKQILINLLSNAIKFVDEGEIQIHISKISHRSINQLFMLNHKELPKNPQLDQFQDIQEESKQKNYDNTILNDENEFIRFQIMDTGKGLNDELINNINSDESKIIQKENTSQNRLGTGYGLNIVQNLCKLLKSKLHVKKNDPYGSIFYFDIPNIPIMPNMTNYKLNSMVEVTNSLNNIEDNEDKTTEKKKNSIVESEMTLSQILFDKETQLKDLNNEDKYKKGIHHHSESENLTSRHNNSSKLIFDNYPESKSSLLSSNNVINNNELFNNSNNTNSLPQTRTISSHCLLNRNNEDLFDNKVNKNDIELRQYRRMTIHHIENNIFTRSNKKTNTIKKKFNLKLPSCFFNDKSNEILNNKGNITESKDNVDLVKVFIYN